MNHHATSYAARTLCVISRRKAGALKHAGLLLPNGRVAHCAPSRGEHVSRVEDFAMGQDITIIEEIPRHLHAAILKRIAASVRMPQGYHATVNNCEMYVNRMLGRSVVSPQLSEALLIVSVVALIGLATAA